jgi:hypothetical protein
VLQRAPRERIDLNTTNVRAEALESAGALRGLPAALPRAGTLQPLPVLLILVLFSAIALILLVPAFKGRR